MKKTKGMYLGLLAVLLSPMAANGTLITFDDLASGTPLTNQYAGLGVTFDGIEDGSSFAPVFCVLPTTVITGVAQ